MREYRPMNVETDFFGREVRQPSPPDSLVEARVLELENMGLIDEWMPAGELSGVRQFAYASLLHRKPPYFVTLDDQLLAFRDRLELRYGMAIFSVPEALMLLREFDGPPN